LVGLPGVCDNQFRLLLAALACAPPERLRASGLAGTKPPPSSLDPEITDTMKSAG
jgi:hypothetical protein